MSKFIEVKGIVSGLCCLMLLCTILTGCSSNKYEKANELYDNGEYQSALELYEQLGDYEDSLKKAEVCKKEIGMRENADYDFLKKIEESILNRMETNKKEDVDRTTLVNTELAFVEGFKEKTFYDENLKALANKYIEGLSIQKEALKKEYIYEYQIEWQKGIVYRYEVLKALYENYNFLTENNDFIGTYVSQYEDEKELFNAYNAIEKDLDSQLNADDFKWGLKDYEFYCTIKNNTQYEYSTAFVVNFLDSKGIMYESNETYIENIKPGSSYVVSVYISNPDKLHSFEWYNYYGDIKT